MIYSKYFPESAECIAEISHKNFSESPTIEVPADVYDAATRKGAVPNFILRGAYDYATAKIIAQSGCVEALTFDDGSGEILTSSTVGISAEITFALAVWNGYTRDDAIDRTILSSLKNAANTLPELLAEKISRVTITDGKSVKKSLAKALAGKAASQVEDELVFLIRHGEDVTNFAKGRISDKQFVKNTLITLAGVAGTAAIVAMSGLPGGAIIVNFFASFGGNLWFRDGAKNFLDNFIDDDSKYMLDIIGDEMAKILDGQFLTQYELEILTECLHDALNKTIVQDMFALHSREEQAAFADAFITQRLEEIFRQRRFVEMPSADEWAQGLQRVTKGLENGEDFAANMKRKRDEALMRRRAFLDKYNLKPYDAAPIVQALNAVTKTQRQTERAFQRLAESERRYAEIHRQQAAARAKTKDALKEILSNL